jgi:hypothetical protein
VSFLQYEYTATLGQTTFSGADDNSATLSYTVANLIVTLNGVVLDNGGDYTATNGTSVVLTSGAAAGDLLQVIAFKSFTVADMVPASTGGTFAGNVAVNGNLTVDTDTLFVDAANNVVGIGTSSPSTYGLFSAVGSTNGFQSVSFVNTSDGSSAVNRIQVGNDASAGAGQIVVYGSQHSTLANVMDVNNANSAALRLLTNNTERARLDTSGNLLVGTTSSPVAGKIASSFLSSSSEFGSVFIDSQSNNTAIFAQFRNGSGALGSITNNNNTAVAYNTSSDYRLKEDVQPMVGASDRLMALKPVNFAWKVDGSRVDGFLAHEAQAVVPESVTGEKDQVQIVEIKDEGGNVTGTEERPVYQGIDQSKIVPLLTAALQEALTKIEQLEARMAILEGGAA